MCFLVMIKGLYGCINTPGTMSNYIQNNLFDISSLIHLRYIVVNISNTYRTLILWYSMARAAFHSCNLSLKVGFFLLLHGNRMEMNSTFAIEKAHCRVHIFFEYSFLLKYFLNYILDKFITRIELDWSMVEGCQNKNNRRCTVI